MRIIYSLVFYFLIPFLLLRLLWRGFKSPEYLRRWNERFAWYPKKIPPHDIWFHAVSVGEAETLFPLVKRLQQAYPDIKLLVTTTTPTGSARVRAVLKDSVSHVYLPYDFPGAVNRFLKQFKPRIAVILETEIWPNLFAACGANNAKLVIINACLSESSARGYQKISALIRPAISIVTHISAQTKEDAARFIAIGAPAQRIEVIGNLKFDVEVGQQVIDQGLAIKKAQFSGRFVWVLGSTHKDEEVQFVEIYRQLKKQIPELLLVVVPRHPERFETVKGLFEQQNFEVITRSSMQQCHAGIDVYLVDTMGELKTFYAAADVAFVGGSLVPIGGHNILEAAAVGVSVIVGPFVDNIKEIVAAALSAESLIQCRNAEDIVEAVLNIYQQPSYKNALIENGKAFITANRGVTASVFTTLISLIKPESEHQ